MLSLHDYVLSGSCYKVRLLLALPALDYERVPVDFYPGRQHKSPSYLALNPLGQIPVLETAISFCAMRRRSSPTSPTPTTRREPGCRATRNVSGR